MEERKNFAVYSGEYVRQARSPDGITQSDICRALQLHGVEISEQSFSMKERGEVRFSAQELLLLSLILGFSLDHLIHSYIESRIKKEK